MYMRVSVSVSTCQRKWAKEWEKKEGEGKKNRIKISLPNYTEEKKHDQHSPGFYLDSTKTPYYNLKNVKLSLSSQTSRLIDRWKI